MIESHPQSKNKGQAFAMSFTSELRENLPYIALDLPLSVYTQDFVHATSDMVPIHWHNEIQLTWVISGSLEYRVNNKTFHLTPNTLLFVNPHQLHTSKTIDQDTHSLCLNFTDSLFIDYIQTHFINPITQNPSLAYAMLPLQPNQLKQLQSFIELDNTPFHHLEVINFIMEIIEQLYPLTKEESKPVNKKELALFYAMIEYIHSHYDKQLTVTAIAKQAFTNKNRCTALFNKYASTSPIKYLNNYRLNQAKDLLLQTSQSVSDISLAVGFNQLSHFIELFRLNYGLSPLKYRTFHSKTIGNDAIEK